MQKDREKTMGKYSKIMEITINRGSREFLSANELAKTLRNALSGNLGAAAEKGYWLDMFFDAPGELQIGFLMENGFSSDDIKNLVELLKPAGFYVEALRNYVEEIF